MPSKRDLSLDNYGISGYRYRELKNYCLQYNEWQDELKYNTTTVGSKVITDMPICHGQGNPMETLVDRRIELESKCQLIEKTLENAISALYNGEVMCLYPIVLKAIVNEHMSYNYLDEVCCIPCGHRKYWEIRRFFFFLLDGQKR